MALSDYITPTGLKKERGWTDKLIKKFLGAPDETRTNPHYSCAAPMKLYLKSRVEQAEASAEFQKEYSVARKRSETAAKSASRAVETKINQLIEVVEEMSSVDFPDLTKDELIKEACDHYNSQCFVPDHVIYKRDMNGRGFKEATPQSDENFLSRITVNYLRHMHSGYDDCLYETRGRVGKDEAAIHIKNLVLDSIAEKFPWLSQECRRQEC